MVQQVTNKVERTGGGMPEYAFMKPYIAKIDGKPFLKRFILFRTPLCSIDITRICTDDLSRPFPHDHSRSFVSLKFGTYDEWVYYNPEEPTERRFRKHRRFSFHQLRHNQAHTITRVSPKLVTILFLGPKRHGSSYWTPTGLQSTGMKVDQNDSLVRSLPERTV
jgi:hypothetical protein